MDTVYDWVTLAIFAGLIVLFLQRATSDRAEKDVSLFYYLGAGAGCAVANYLGNHDQGILAWVLLAATAGFIVYFLKPFHRPSQS
jgi:hypothetical protein